MFGKLESKDFLAERPCAILLLQVHAEKSLAFGAAVLNLQLAQVPGSRLRHLLTSSQWRTKFSS